MPRLTAWVRISYPSSRVALPNGVFTSSTTSPESMRSVTLGEPSWIFFTTSQSIPAALSADAVPSVATKLNPSRAKSRAMDVKERLSWSQTLTNTFPDRGSV